jgi:hypothetical protein
MYRGDLRLRSLFCLGNVDIFSLKLIGLSEYKCQHNLALTLISSDFGIIAGNNRVCLENTMRVVKKQNLPSKVCAACGRPFTWRKKWERNWDDVKYCSDKCRKARSAAGARNQR